MSNFKAFARAIETQYDHIAKGELYVVDISDEEIKDTYLNAFPEGTNEVYKTNSEHDCSCCKQFIRNIGKLVALDGGRRITVWGVGGLPYPYDVVAAALNEAVMKAPIRTVFRTSERQFGKGETRQLLEDGTVKRWDHFEGRVGNKHFCSNPAERRSGIESSMQVFRRGMEELSLEAVQTVLDLIKDKNLYRGEEHKEALTSFKKLKVAYSKVKDKDVFLWENINDHAARFRNTVIGSLVIDLSKGESLDKAVGMFESKVAPHNYKRPKALITQKMIKDAVETLKSLDMEHAVERRFARIEDVSVNNVLFVDNSVQGKMKGGLEGLLMEEVTPKKPDFKKATKVTIDEFMERIVPSAKSIHAVVDNRHMGNFMSVTAPQHGDSGGLFKWNNDFAWAYDGNITDSVQERVKAAGGKVDGAALRFSLSWFNYDDLDIHVITPQGSEIYFCNKVDRASGGVLDVDMNVGATTREAVENVSWSKRPSDGVYTIKIHNYTKRESIDVGFDIQIADIHTVRNFSYRKPVSGAKVALEVTVKDGIITAVKPAAGVTGDNQPVNKWGVKTNSLVKVQTMMFSPNYWDDNKEGNKHWFFILENCKNEEPVRGFFNEYLNNSLTKHRKVFEILADKTKCEVTDNQLSGVGFSSTKKETLNVVVDNKPFEISFG